MVVVSQVVEYDRPSVLLESRESAFSRLVEASQVDDAAAVVQQATDVAQSVIASV